MIEVAKEVWLMEQFPRWAINVYVAEGFLIDAGTRFDRGRIARQLRGVDLKGHVLTHAHPDHQGCTRWVCERLGVPLWCGEGDADAAEDTAVMLGRLPDRWFNRVFGPIWSGPGCGVERRLKEGDRVGNFEVIETPGHTAGHVSLWRASDRLLILGDVLAHMDMKRWRVTLKEPPACFSADPARNRESARRVAAMRPEIVAFGHGPPLRDYQALSRFVAERLSREA